MAGWHILNILDLMFELFEDFGQVLGLCIQSGDVQAYKEAKPEERRHQCQTQAQAAKEERCTSNNFRRL